MEINQIKTETDYEAAVAEIEHLMDAEADTPAGDRLDVLTTLVEAFEERHHPIEAPDPIAAIEFRMAQMGLARKDLESLIGPRGRVSEVLSGKRSLSLAMIRNLNRELNIPAEVLIQDTCGKGTRRRTRAR